MEMHNIYHCDKVNMIYKLTCEFSKDKLEVLAQLLIKKETLNYQDVEDLLGKYFFTEIEFCV